MSDRLAMLSGAVLAFASFALTSGARAQPVVAAKRGYDGPPQPPETVAVLTLSGGVEACVRSPGGKTLRFKAANKPTRVELLPGTQTLEVRPVGSAGSQAQPVAVSWTAEAGRQYTLTYSLPTCMPVVRDEESGARLFPPAQSARDDLRSWPPPNWAWVCVCDSDRLAVVSVSSADGQISGPRTDLLAVAAGWRDLRVSFPTESSVRSLGRAGRLTEYNTASSDISLALGAGHLYFLTMAGVGPQRTAVLLNATLGYRSLRPGPPVGDYEPAIAKCLKRLRREYASVEADRIPVTMREVLPTEATAEEQAAVSQRCEGGDASACYEAALLSAPARRLSSDLGKAVELYRRACEMGEPRACARIHSLDP
jgi:TPR repeat protein